eukprot:m.97455 g.97455  ORF g.97455 m.97455 type:complete len:207 (-) comp10216_c1_seq2:1233-1853(-)
MAYSGMPLPPPITHLWFHLPPPATTLPLHFYQPPSHTHTPHSMVYADARVHDDNVIQSHPMAHAATSVHEADETVGVGRGRAPDGDAYHAHDEVDDMARAGAAHLESIDPVFLEFRRATLAHRKSRDAARAAAARRDAMEAKRAASAETARQARALHVAARDRELKERYGTRVDDILQLEARVDMLHDATVDAHGPALWPSLPLNL